MELWGLESSAFGLAVQASGLLLRKTYGGDSGGDYVSHDTSMILTVGTSLATKLIIICFEKVLQLRPF